VINFLAVCREDDIRLSNKRICSESGQARVETGLIRSISVASSSTFVAVNCSLLVRAIVPTCPVLRLFP